MAGRQAKTLSETMLARALRAIARRPFAQRNAIILLLSARAGLRACEIAGLQWSMVLDETGRVSGSIEIQDSIAKRGSGRRIPMHPQLRLALAAGARSSSRQGPVIASAKGGSMAANSIV